MWFLVQPNTCGAVLSLLSTSSPCLWSGLAVLQLASSFYVYRVIYSQLHGHPVHNVWYASAKKSFYPADEQSIILDLANSCCLLWEVVSVSWWLLHFPNHFTQLVLRVFLENFCKIYSFHLLLVCIRLHFSLLQLCKRPLETQRLHFHQSHQEAYEGLQLSVPLGFPCSCNENECWAKAQCPKSQTSVCGKRFCVSIQLILKVTFLWTQCDLSLRPGCFFCSQTVFGGPIAPLEQQQDFGLWAAKHMKICDVFFIPGEQT